MKGSKILLFTLTCLLFTYVISAQESGNKPGMRTAGGETANDTSNVQLIYQCQAHPQVLSNIDGRCPRCEMQLKAYTLEEAFANLSKSGVKKPELSPHYITKTVVEEEVILDDSAEVGDTVFVIDETVLDDYDFDEIDHDGDGMLYQCPNHPKEFEDESGNCLVCDTQYEFLTIDQVKTNLVRKKQIKEPDEKGQDTADAGNP